MEGTKLSKEPLCRMHSSPAVYGDNFLQCQFVKLRVSCDKYLSVRWSMRSHCKRKGFQQSLKINDDVIWTGASSFCFEKSEC